MNASTIANFDELDSPAVSVAGVGLVYGGIPGTTALQGINLAVHKGEFVSILGPSGCGKTTLLRLIAGLIRPTTGIIRVFNSSSDSQRQAGNIGFVFQRPVLLPWRTLLQNVTLPLDFHSEGNGRECGPQEALRSVGLLEFAGHYPYQVSGGMAQRASLARALVHAPQLLLMDEPFGALDELSRLEMDELVLRLHAEAQFTGLLVTHSIHEAVYLADRVVVLSARPGTPVADLRIDLPRPRSRAVLDDAEFLHHAKCLRDLLFSGV